LVQGDRNWHLEPNDQLPEEHILTWLHRDFAGGQVCMFAVADDVHHVRSVEVMRRYDLEKALVASRWIRKRELAFHASVTTVITISEEDSVMLNSSFDGMLRPTFDPPGTLCWSCTCSWTWVPYVVEVIAEPLLEPFERRQNGMLYVGGMHGLALIAIEWLVQHVQRTISTLVSRGDLELSPGGMGHIYVAGPGWVQHARESDVLNRSMIAGHVTLLGVLSELQLSQRLQQHKVFAAPVFNGTGIATKNVLAMARGIPLVTTSVGLHGLGLSSSQGGALAADTPETFARKVLQLQTSPKSFTTTWRMALRHAALNLSPSHQQLVLCRMLGCNLSEIQNTDVIDEKTLNLCSMPTADAHRSMPAPAEHAVLGLSQLRTHTSRALVLLGLVGSGVNTLASRLHSNGGCLVQGPLQGMRVTHIEAQADHLASILRDPALCQVLTQQDVGTHPTMHGFTLEFARGGGQRSLLSTRGGIEVLIRLFQRWQPRVLVVRRCNMIAWAMQRISTTCETSTRSCLQSSPRDLLAPANLVSEASRFSEQDVALRFVVLNASLNSHFFNYEWLFEERTASTAFMKLQAFLGISLPRAVLVRRQLSMTDALLMSKFSDKVYLHQSSSIRLGDRLAQGECGSTTLHCTTTMAATCSWAWASAALAALPQPGHPMLAIGVHFMYGGSSMVGKLVAEACRVWLTPQLGIRCSFRDVYDACDPNLVDLCLHKQARFSEGRFSTRGYRFVHVVRDPIDMLVRSYIAAVPNATRTLNSSALMADFDRHLRAHDVMQEVHDMQAISESHASDPHYLRVAFEDLSTTDMSRRNRTMTRMFNFLLEGWNDYQHLATSLLQLAKLRKPQRNEDQSSSEIKPLVRLLQRKPAKCHHIARLQALLKYAAITCVPER